MTSQAPGTITYRYARLQKVIASCAILMALCLFFAVVEPRFLNISNILNVLRLAAILSLAAYTMSGLLAGLTAVVLTSRINSGQANLAPSLPFDTIAAAAVGGLSMYGGQGRLYQPVVGALIITVTNNGLNLLNVSSYVQMMIIGIVILLAVAYDNYRLSEKMREILARGFQLKKDPSLRSGSS